MYVHVPFCRHRCDYCAFATYTDRDHLMARYVDACVAEIERAVDAGELPPATSVFFGGGTPSRLAADELCRVLDAVPRAPGAEVTVECNPEDASAARFATYRAAGVTRISLGVQSTAPHVLAGLGRRHDPAAVRRAADLVADAGFASYNLDLIFGGAGETDDDWARSLDDVLALPSPPPHVSAYALDRRAGDAVGHRAGRAIPTTTSRPPATSAPTPSSPRPATAGRRSRTGPSPATAAGTTSSTGPRATTAASVPPPTRTAAAAGGGTSGRPTATSTRSSTAGPSWRGRRCSRTGQRTFEQLSLSLRTPAGVPASALDELDEMAREGLVDRQGNRAVLTVRGRLLANAVTTRLRTPGD